MLFFFCCKKAETKHLAILKLIKTAHDGWDFIHAERIELRGLSSAHKTKYDTKHEIYKDAKHYFFSILTDYVGRFGIRPVNLQASAGKGWDRGVRYSFAAYTAEK